MTAVVIGANGFLGRHLVSNLLSNGQEVVAVFHKHRQHLPPGIKSLPFSKLKSIREPVDTVYYTAGNYNQPFEKLYESQIGNLKIVGEAFPKARLVYASSVAVYGDSQGVINEKAPFRSPDAYGLAKLAGEYVASHQPHFRIVRLAALYGVGVNPDLFISVIIRNTLSGKQIILEEGGERLRNFLHVNDAAALLASAGNFSKSGIFLGTSRKSYRLREIAGLVAIMVPGTTIVTRGKNCYPDYRMDNSWTRKALKWQEKYSLKKGLEEMMRNAV
jgi:nucleoside-diphosphate-sugar epimerase